MLIQLLNQAIDNINALDPDTESAALLGEIERNRPDIIEKITRASDGKSQQVAMLVARGVLQTIKRVPEIIHRLVEPLQRRSHDPATRCALASVLAYVAQPNDLVPDDAPGGYGYLDDYILARAGLIEFLTDVDPKGEVTTDTLKMAADLLPKDVVPQMQQAVDGLSMSYQLMRRLPPFMLEMTTDQIVANPLTATQSMATAAATPFRSPPNIGGGFWGRSGAYVEGNNIITPGGASLIDGQLFIPD